MAHVTLVTGASSGLGAALARRFARDGDAVALAARRMEPMEALAREIRDAGGTALAVEMDVTDRESVAAGVRRVQRELGDVDRLVANAGIDKVTPGVDFRAADVEFVFRTNVFGVVYAVEAVLPRMLERGAGHVVAISSLAGYRGMPGAGAYCASKSAVTTLMESLRIELRPKGIHFTTICPGFIKTPMTAPNQFPMPLLMELDDAVDSMYRAVMARKRHHAFPRALAGVLRASLFVPDALFDAVLANQRADKG